MFDSINTYNLHTEEAEGITHYFVSFQDGQAVTQVTEVSKDVYEELKHFARDEHRQQRSYRRHIEQFGQTEESLHERAIIPQANIEITIESKILVEQLYAIIQQLPDIQRRRFAMHYIQGFNYEQIAVHEKCSARAVQYSIGIVKEKLKNFL